MREILEAGELGHPGDEGDLVDGEEEGVEGTFAELDLGETLEETLDVAFLVEANEEEWLDGLGEGGFEEEEYGLGERHEGKDLGSLGREDEDLGEIEAEIG